MYDSWLVFFIGTTLLRQMWKNKITRLKKRRNENIKILLIESLFGLARWIILKKVDISWKIASKYRINTKQKWIFVFSNGKQKKKEMEFGSFIINEVHFDRHRF